MSIDQLVIQLAFYLFAIGAIVSSLVVVTTRQPVQGVLFLVLAFLAMAGIWILLHAEFLALILVVVYVGAVMTLFLFVVMMLNLDLAGLKKKLLRYLPIGLVMVLFIFALIYLVVGPTHVGLSSYPAPTPEPRFFSNVQQLGWTLYNYHLYAFELAGILLLVAMIASITLAFQGPRNRRVVNVKDQLVVRKGDRLKLIKMDPAVKPRDDGREAPRDDGREAPRDDGRGTRGNGENKGEKAS